MVFKQCKEVCNEWERNYGIPLGLLYSLIIQESSCNPQAVGQPTKYGTAYGIAQFLPSTARAECGLSKDDLFDPYKAIPCAARYLAASYGEFGSWAMAVASYHDGRGNTRKYSPCLPDPLKRPLTYRYVTQIFQRARLQLDNQCGQQTPQTDENDNNPPVTSDNKSPVITGGIGNMFTGNFQKYLILIVAAVLLLYAVSRLR